MEEISTRYIEDENREALIKHWEETLSNAHHAVYVAQGELNNLYRQRYEKVTVQVESTGYQRRLDVERQSDIEAARAAVEAAYQTEVA